MTLSHPRSIPKTCPYPAVGTGYGWQDAEVSNCMAATIAIEPDPHVGSSGVRSFAQASVVCRCLYGTAPEAAAACSVPWNVRLSGRHVRPKTIV
jgi:hypothetical protein